MGSKNFDLYCYTEQLRAMDDQEDDSDVIRCPECGEECNVIPLDNAFGYAGTHCTGGLGGTHYPDGYGTPVSECCEAEIEGFEFPEYGPDYDDILEGRRCGYE